MGSSLTFQESPTPSDQEEETAKPQTLVGSRLEAETFFRSSYYKDSYEFPWNPDPLAQGNSYKIYDEMRNDDQIKVVLSIKKDFVVNSGWYIECENEDIKTAITENLENLESDEGFSLTFDEILRDLLSAYDFGFSLGEPVYIPPEKSEEGLYQYKTINVRAPHTFRFEVDDYGKITQVIQSTPIGEEPFDPNKFIHFAYQQEYGNPYGKSDLRAAHLAWRAKKFFIKYFNVYVEKFAAPLLVGKYPLTYLPDDVNRFHNILKSAQFNTVLTAPMDAMIDIVRDQKDASPAYINGLNFYNTQIARAILVPDLMGMSGEQTSSGSYALGKEQFKVFINSVQKDRLLLARKITQRLINPIVRANWGMDVKAKFIFHPYTHDDELELAKLWKDFVSTGKAKPSEEGLDHFSNVVRFPQKSLEFVETPDPIGGGFGDPKDKGKIGDQLPDGELEKDKSKKDEKAKKDQEDLTQKIFRQHTTYEKKIDFAQIQKVLSASDDKILPKLTSAAKDIYRDYIKQIRDKKIIANFKPESIENLQPKFLKPMNIVFRNHFIDLFKASLEQARKEIFPNGQKKFVAEDILPDEFIDIIEAESFKTVGDYSAEITKKAKNIVIKGLKDGISDAEIIRLIRDELEDVTERWLNTVVRTKTTEMYNSARKTYWDTDPLASQIVEAYQFSAILDERTSQVCESLDGKIFSKGEYIDRVTPPLHFNCRSLLIPVTKFEDYEEDDEIPLEELQNIGGNLIVATENQIVKKEGSENA